MNRLWNWLKGLLQRKQNNIRVVKGHPNSTCHQLGDVEEDPIMLEILNAALEGNAVFAYVDWGEPRGAEVW